MAEEKEKKKKQSFFKGLKKEFKKVQWPTRGEVAKETIAVTIISVVVGALIVLIDGLLQAGIHLL